MPAHPDPEAPLDPSDVRRLITVLSRDDVRQALLYAASTPMPMETLSGMPVLPGLSWEQTADLVTALKRVFAAYSPIPDSAGRLYWFTYTNRIRKSLSIIDQRCTADSELHRRITSRSGARFVVQSNVEEAVATAQLDGVDISYETAKELLFMQRHPRTAEEQLVVNHYRLSEELDDLVDRPWTPELLFDLYGRLTRGIPADLSHPAPGLDRSAQTGVTSGLCWLASNYRWHHCVHPAVVACLVRKVTSYWNLFPAWNGMMSRILFRLAALKFGYPVLSYIPISQSLLKVQRVQTEELPAHHAQPSVLTVWQEVDSTPWLDAQLSLVVHALRQLDARMTRATRIDDAVRQELQADKTLNHRQRSIIGRALRIPDAEFRIGYHRTTHGIGYATAHRDFTELVDKGYLTETTEGRMKVFRAGPRLSERLGALADVGQVKDYEVPLPPELASSATAGLLLRP